MQATATVVDTRASETMLARARRLVRADTAPAPQALAAARIDILRPRATPAATDNRIIVVIQYLY
jgi:hypothetical protein